MYECFDCNKKFKYKSQYTDHKNRKTPCSKIEENKLTCKICNVSFTRQSELLRHEKTNKHITNYNKCNVQNNIHGDNIQNIINLTLNVNSFKDTDMKHISKSLVVQTADFIKNNVLDNETYDEIKKLEIIIDEIIYLLKKLHFNISVEENQNLKILLIFPSIKKTVYEYLILEISPTHNIIWNSLTFEDFLSNILDNLLILNNRFDLQLDNFKEFINYTKDKLLNNKTNLQKLKPTIDNKLSQMYINFNEEQKKPDRHIYDDFVDKLTEYKQYRKQECKLNNGFNPDILNSKI